MIAVAAMCPPFTWDEMKRGERRLAALEAGARFVARHAGRAPSFCANAYYYDAIKPILLDLVGDDRGYDDDAEDEDLDARGRVLSVEEIFGTLPPRRPAKSNIEKFLRSREAYELAASTLYELLPGCRACGCLRIESCS